MWVKLVEIVKARTEETNQPRSTVAKAVNALYGTMTSCQVAFQRCETEQTEANFANFAFAIDALISTLQNLNPQLEVFDPKLAEELGNYALGQNRINAMSRPRELVTSQLKLLRRLVRMESDVMHLPLQEFGSFSEAMEDLGGFIKQSFTPDDLFDWQTQH